MNFSRRGEKSPQLERRKSQMGKLISKVKYMIKVENYPHTNIISKPATMRRGEYKYKKLELHLKLGDQQLKTCMYIHCYIKTSWEL